MKGYEVNTAMFNEGKCQQFPYNISDLKIVNFAKELNIPVLVDNGYTSSYATPKLSSSMPNIFGMSLKISSILC